LKIPQGIIAKIEVAFEFREELYDKNSLEQTKPVSVMFTP
jgi:hypothetical protein